MRFHLPDVLCVIIVSYHIFFDMKQTQYPLCLLYALPFNDKYFYGITSDALVRCCTQTLAVTTLFSIPNITTFLLQVVFIYATLQHVRINISKKN